MCSCRYSTPHLRFLCLAHINTKTAPSTRTPITNTTPPIPPATSSIIPNPAPVGVVVIVVVVAVVVSLEHSAWAVNDSTSIGQFALTAILFLWTSMDACPTLTHCSMDDSTLEQFGWPDSSARNKTTCGSIVHRKCLVLMWFAVNEHWWHLALTSEIMELVISTNLSSVLSNCKG